MLPLAVFMRQQNILGMPPDRRPKPDDIISCLECHGQAHGCGTCGDHGALPRREALAFYIGAHGDVLQYGGGKRGEAAKAFNVLAEGLALLSFCPGGVKFAGMHFGAPEETFRIIRKAEPAVPRMRRPI
jgi:hypothetical protein